MASQEAVAAFEQALARRYDETTAAVVATEDYLHHGGPEPVDNPRFIATISAIREPGVAESPGYLGHGQSQD